MELKLIRLELKVVWKVVYQVVWTFRHFEEVEFQVVRKYALRVCQMRVELEELILRIVIRAQMMVLH